MANVKDYFFYVIYFSLEFNNIQYLFDCVENIGEIAGTSIIILPIDCCYVPDLYEHRRTFFKLQKLSKVFRIFI